MRSRCRCSMCSAIHINSRSWLRSSSTHEPSDPPLKVVFRLAKVTAALADRETRIRIYSLAKKKGGECEDRGRALERTRAPEASGEGVGGAESRATL